MSAPCIACGKPSTLLCDYQIGWPIGGYVRDGAIENDRFYAVIDATKMPFTCDAAICDACGTRKGSVFISGEQPGSDSIDHCPLHSSLDNHLCHVIDDNEASAIRRDIFAYYRRKQFAALAPAPAQSHLTGAAQRSRQDRLPHEGEKE